jgi:hypothetical protein
MPNWNNSKKKILLQFIFILLEKNLWVEFLKIDKKNASILMEIGGPEIVGDRKHLANTYKIKTAEVLLSDRLRLVWSSLSLSLCLYGCPTMSSL